MKICMLYVMFMINKMREVFYDTSLSFSESWSFLVKNELKPFINMHNSKKKKKKKINENSNNSLYFFIRLEYFCMFA